MRKKAFMRGLLGFPLGIAIGHLISVIGSLFYGDGGFYPVAPDLIAAVGNEINAVALQTLLCGVIGGSFAASSVVWEIERWSIVKQTGVYFLTNALLMLPVAYILNWMKHSIMGFISYFGIFTIYFFVIWAIQYFAWKKAVKRINVKLRSMSDDENTSL